MLWGLWFILGFWWFRVLGFGVLGFSLGFWGFGI